LKLHSETITHKTDVGGVQLNLRGPDGVRSAFEAIRKSVLEKAGEGHFLGVTVQPMVKMDGYELILGSSVDAQFGPVLLFGMGGQLVEVFQDRALGLPPLTTTLARRLMEQTKIYKALKGVRGRAPVDLAALEKLLVRFSQMVADQRWVTEIDINPLMASSERLVALDARFVLQPEGVAEECLPRLSIRAYPNRYVGSWTTKGGEEVTVRPIRPDDEPLMVKFHETLSERTVYFRYLSMLKLSTRIAHDRLTRICFIDYARQMALVAERCDEDGNCQIIGVGRLHKNQSGQEAEFALVVSDAYQGQGLGKELLRRLLDVAKQEKVSRVTAEISGDNYTMQGICKSMGFTLKRDTDETTVSAHIDI
jgi:acetyltransferase